MVYEKLVKIKYKSKIAYIQIETIIQKIDLINEKIKYIEEKIELKNKDLIFKEKLITILKKQYKKYKEEEKKIKIQKNIEKRKEKENSEKIARIKEEELRLEQLQKEEELRKIRLNEYQKALVIKKRTMIIQKYKDRALYLPRKVYRYGTNVIVNIKNKTVIYVHNFAYTINYIYKSISFLTMLKVLLLCGIIGLFMYGKYTHYMDEQKRLELIKVHESKIRYNQKYHYKSHHYKSHDYKSHNYKKY